MQKKNTILTLTVLFISVITIAQPLIKQQRTSGGTGEDIFEAMALTADGGFIITTVIIGYCIFVTKFLLLLQICRLCKTHIVRMNETMV
jgi:hypothetical protein